jgi:hypothetical protein
MVIKEKLINMSIGYFGWGICGNIAFLLFFLQFIEGLTVIDGTTFSGIVYFLTIISTLALLLNKKHWISAGVASAFFINTILWIIWPFLLDFYALSEISGLNFYEVGKIMFENHHIFDLTPVYHQKLY